MKTMFKKVLLAAATVATLGAAGTASALPSFTFDPKGGGSTASSTPLGPAVTADQMQLSSSELITFGNGGATASAVGYIIVTGFLNGNSPPTSIGGYPALDGYELYFTFTLTNHIVGSANGVVTYALDSLNYNLHIDQHAQNSAGSAVFHQPTTAPVNGVSDGTVTLGTGDKIIASGSLVPGSGTANIINGTGVSLNSKEYFTYDKNYFTAPNPFYGMIFDAFNNTPGSFSQSANGQYGAVVNTGGVLNFTSVPEPSSVALFGIALVGMGVAARRRRKD